MKLSGWGRYPVIESTRLSIKKTKDLASHIRQNPSLISYGNGRSYGDSALAEYHLPMTKLNRYLNFDKDHGLLTCEAGVLLSDIIETFLPRGWFLKITPGTKYITVGGAIAADVHGKNHHVEGCFSQCVKNFRLLMSDGSIQNCSPDNNSTLFKATCGGMGLTGVIIEATIQLKSVQSQWITQTTIKTSNLEETFNAFEKYAECPYSVAWVDTLAKKSKMGRSVLTVGSFSEDGDLSYETKSNINIPTDMPSFLLNKRTIQAFNYLYYSKVKSGTSNQKVHFDSFFYPLDRISNWNKIYGKNGFVQYQFILPKAVSFDGLQKILTIINKSKFSSFLAVLKLYGKSNNNFLSFPMEGFSLALDFKMQPGLIDFLHLLSDRVLKFEGRIYLAKDAVMKKETFDLGYPKASEFRKLRRSLQLNNKFNSLQSERLGL